jgi:hypothetical protein
MLRIALSFDQPATELGVDMTRHEPLSVQYLNTLV